MVGKRSFLCVYRLWYYLCLYWCIYPNLFLAMGIGNHFKDTQLYY